MDDNRKIEDFVNWFTKIGDPEYDGDRRKAFTPNRLSDNHMVIWTEKTSGKHYTTKEVIQIYNKENNNNDRTRNTKAD